MIYSLKGFDIFIDEEDLHFMSMYMWDILDKKGKKPRVYFKRGKGQNTCTLYLSRVILGITDANTIVDHINGNPLDNRKENLRLSDKSTNGMNRSKNKNNTTGYKGVVWYPTAKTFSAELMVRGVRYRKHGFKTAKEAAKKYNELAIEHHGEFARLNKIEES